MRVVHVVLIQVTHTMCVAHVSNIQATRICEHRYGRNVLCKMQDLWTWVRLAYPSQLDTEESMLGDSEIQREAHVFHENDLTRSLQIGFGHDCCGYKAIG
ncbi:hypothetical protein AHAS_Ahas20G0277700 [Arachis hypogaea]